MKIFDSHCHLEDWMIKKITEEFAADGDNFLCCNIGCNIASSQESAALAEKIGFVYAAVGIHPEFAEEISEEAVEKLKTLSKNEKVVAIGEIGLDYHWDDNPPKEKQRECFERQIELAKEINMPIAIHSRDADQETMDMLKAHRAFESIKVLLHCFSGSAELARQYVKLGAWISIAGPVTYKNNRKTVEVVASVPLDRLLIETDSPYLTPVPFRGQPNYPGFVIHTAGKIAEIKNIPAGNVFEQTFLNAKQFYGI